MKPSNVLDAILEAHKQNLVPMLVGQPGVGKSSLVQAVADHQGVSMIDFRPALHGIEDLIGLPTFSDDKKSSSFATPSWLPRSGKGIFFIDELPQALPGMMAALSQFILDRKLGDYTLPDGWKIVVAGNRLQDRAATHRMPSHINDRLAFITVEFSIDDFSEWCFHNNINDAVRAFVKFKPTAVTSFDPAMEINCTPRSLVMASKFIDSAKEIRTELMQGTIGEGYTAEFLSYLNVYMDLPDIKDVESKPKTTRIPSDDKPDVMYGISTMLSSHATPDNFDALITYMDRMPKEYLASFVKEAIRLHNDLADTPAFEKFLKDNHSILA